MFIFLLNSLLVRLTQCSEWKFGILDIELLNKLHLYDKLFIFVDEISFFEGDEIS